MGKTHIDLFSGIGGFALAAKWAGLKTVQFVEIEEFAQKVLTKNFPGVPIHEDIKTFRADGIVSPFLLTGGYPCQPFSQAGKRLGKADPRHVWPEMFRVIRECRPNWVLAENVSGHIKLGLEEVLTDLEGEGYDSQVFHIGAVAKDAPHRRMRLWIVAHAKYGADRTNGGKEREEESIQGINRETGLSGLSGGTSSNSRDVADSECNPEGTTHRGNIGISSGGWQEQGVSKGNQVWGDSGNSSKDVADSIGHGLNRSRSENFQQRELGYSISGISSESRGQDVADSNLSGPQGCKTPGNNVENREEPTDKFVSGCDGDNESCGSGETRWFPEPGLGGTLSDGLPKRLDEDYWMNEPDIPRVGEKIPDRTKRLKAIGNAIVPQVAYEIIRWMR